MRNTVAYQRAGIIVLALALVAMTGCTTTHEQMLGNTMAGNPAAPEWVQGQMPTNASMVYFVGRGVGQSVLDEQGAYQAARNHVIEQVAAQINSRVKIKLERTAGHRSKTREKDSTMFTPTLGPIADTMVAAPFPWMRKEEFDSAMKQCSRIQAEGLVGDLREQDIYWEQWRVNDRPERGWGERRGLRRYKCWILMGIDRARFDARVQTAGMLVLREAAIDLAKVRAQAKQVVVMKDRCAKIAVAKLIYEKELARNENAKPEAVFDVVNHHSHGQSSGKNYTLQDTKDILDGARILAANDKDIYSAAEIESLLSGDKRFYDIYSLIDFGATDTGDAVKIPEALLTPKTISEAADQLFEVYEQMSVDKEGSLVRPKLTEPKLIPSP